MLRTLFGFEWRKSNAHLVLLSKFLYPNSIDDFTGSDDRYPESYRWKTVLGESPKQAIKRFIDEDLLVLADLSKQIDYKYKVTELKDMLKKRGLAVTGRKDEIIQRLVKADTTGMGEVVSGLTVYVCSERGREIANQYITNVESKRMRIEQQILENFRKRRFREASVMMASYESEQVFPRDLGVDWKQHNPARDIEMLELIFSGKPKILARLNNEQLDTLRFAAGMMILWGTNKGNKWLPPDFKTGIEMDVDTAARMLLFYASHIKNLNHYKQNKDVIKQVQISAAGDSSCDACKNISSKIFKLNDVPELPYEHCTHEKGCRCEIIPITKSWKELGYTGIPDTNPKPRTIR